MNKNFLELIKTKKQVVKLSAVAFVGAISVLSFSHESIAMVASNDEYCMLHREAFIDTLVNQIDISFYNREAASEYRRYIVSLGSENNFKNEVLRFVRGEPTEHITSITNTNVLLYRYITRERIYFIYDRENDVVRILGVAANEHDCENIRGRVNF